MHGFSREYWEEVERNKHVLRYSLAPILEEAGTLLWGAGRLWHPWSLRRKKELGALSQEVISNAEFLRDRGLTWAGGALEEVANASYTLYLARYHRYRDQFEPETPCPEAAMYMVSMATKLLFTLLPALQKLEEELREGRKLSEGLCKVIEGLVEAPYYDPTIEISDEIMKIVVSHAIFMECEGLAYMQAKIEDFYTRDHEELKQKKKSDLSDDELRNLSSKIDMSFDTLKDVFETERSSWWKQWEEYRDKSREQVEIFLSSATLSKGIKKGIKSEWDMGVPSEVGSLQFVMKDDVSNSETVIKFFIALLLSFGEGEWSVEPLKALTS